MPGETLGQTPEHALADFVGTYTGIAPTDESSLGMGELEIRIDETGLTRRWATGLQVEDWQNSLAEARELSTIEMNVLSGTTEWRGVMRGFKVENLTYVFFTGTSEPDAPRLFVTGSMGDILGPTLLFASEQVERGLQEELITALEQDVGRPGELPRLANGGVVPHSDPGPQR